MSLFVRIDAVFSGGGVKAYAFIGVLDRLEQSHYTIERVAGTSAGAILASLLAANYQLRDIKQMLQELELNTLLDAPLITKILPFSKWLFLYYQKGLYKGDAFEKWLQKQLAVKSIYTFSDIQPGYLKVVVSDLTLGKLVVIPDDLERVYGIDPSHFSVAKAVRMSAGFPYFFQPKIIQGISKQKSVIVDGGLLSNFPMWIFENGDQKQKRPLLGVKLSSNIEKGEKRTIKHAFDMFTALFSTMKMAHDSRYISKKNQANIIFVPVDDIGAVDFAIDEKTKKQLIHMGQESTTLFLKHWPK